MTPTLNSTSVVTRAQCAQLHNIASVPNPDFSATSIDVVDLISSSFTGDKRASRSLTRQRSTLHRRALRSAVRQGDAKNSRPGAKPIDRTTLPEKEAAWGKPTCEY